MIIYVLRLVVNSSANRRRKSCCISSLTVVDDELNEDALDVLFTGAACDKI